ncbi:hypothetical protein ACU635_53400 [[Actinomadura] parvosata]|uniref:hypothetical protein n=1 Tax=[Actinomadura] parvosata TaxID=1955412 RepID=UPI00406CBBA3
MITIEFLNEALEREFQYLMAYYQRSRNSVTAVHLADILANATTLSDDPIYREAS